MFHVIDKENKEIEAALKEIERKGIEKTTCQIEKVAKELRVKLT